MIPWKYLVVLEILRWCSEVKKVVLWHSKMIRGNTAQNICFLSYKKTITLVRKRWFFSKVLRIQDGQEYLSIKIVCDTKIKLYFTPYSTACNTPLPADNNSKNDPESHIWPQVHYNDCYLPQRPTQEIETVCCGIFDNTSCFIMGDHSTVQHHYLLK